MDETEELCNGFTHSRCCFWIFCMEWCCNSPLHVSQYYKQPEQPLHGRGTSVWALNGKRRKRRNFAIDWAIPVVVSGCFAWNGVVVAPCMYLNPTNSLANLHMGGEQLVLRSMINGGNEGTLQWIDLFLLLFLDVLHGMEFYCPLVCIVPIGTACTLHTLTVNSSFVHGRRTMDTLDVCNGLRYSCYTVGTI